MMLAISQYKKTILAIASIILSVFLLVNCVSKKKESKKELNQYDFAAYAGSQACLNCHKEIYKSHIATGHFLSSAIASEKNIKGSFERGSNHFQFSNGSLMSMEKRGDSLYQVEYVDGREKRKHSFDIVIGSGTKGQSFLYWGGNKLYQNPMTYFTATNEWCNSPGYPNKAMFQKPVTARCLECHVTYVHKTAEPVNAQEEFDRNRIIFGIDCEKCHGPAAQHADFHTKNPSESQAKFIINPKNLSRQQNLDLCALCHGGGILTKTKPSFEYVVGENIADYFTWDTINNSTAYRDVHGNQFGLMMQSKCFRQSSTLTCNTCHNTHKNERGEVDVFSKRCITCHNTEHNNFCSFKSLSQEQLKANCIDCHMPKQPSRSIVVQLQGQPTPVASLLRTHAIKIYPDETKAVVDFLKKSATPKKK